MPTYQRETGLTTQRDKGLLSIPSPNPQIAPGHLRLEAPVSPAIQGHLCQSSPGLRPASPGIASPHGRQSWCSSRRGAASPSPGLACNHEPGAEARVGGRGCPAPTQPHQTDPLRPTHLSPAAPQRQGPRVPPGNLCFCFFREWVKQRKDLPDTPANLPGKPPWLPPLHPQPRQPPPPSGDGQEDGRLTAPLAPTPSSVPQIHAHPEPVTVALFGNRVLTDVLKLRRGQRTGLGWALVQ